MGGFLQGEWELNPYCELGFCFVLFCYPKTDPNLTTKKNFPV